MGWTSGTDLFRVVWSAVYPHLITENDKKCVLKIILREFLEHDWDGETECFDMPYVREITKEICLERGWDWNEEDDEE